MIDYFYEEVERLTKELVSIESIVKMGSESKVAEYIYNYYKELDYFKENPEHLIFQRTKNDQIERHNTICLVQGKGRETRETAVMLGHIDTVGVEDYNYLKEFAFYPDELIEKLKKEELEGDVLEDINSGDYLFGRGALDMKSGVAVQMAVVRYYCENLEKLRGNIVTIAECDEEDSSHGIISALDILNEWKHDYDLEYIVAINSDFTTQMYKGDVNRYIYLGTVGKLLPAFYIAGVETHVGKPFAGLDPNMIASEINKRLNFNTQYCDTVQSETTLPPVCLQLRDLKSEYDVQTALASNSYYNYSTHSHTPYDVLEKMRKLAIDAVDSVILYLNEEYKKWCDITGYSYSKIDWDVGVCTWKEYEDELKNLYGNDYVEYMEEYKKNLYLKNPDMSIPKTTLKIIHKAFSKFNKGDNPAIILYYGSPYYQNVEITGRDEREVRIIESVEKTIESAKNFTEDKLKLKYFYPYISDSSFLFLPRETAGIQAFKDNFPTWGIKYEHPVEKIKRISMPVINIGTYGKDGHKYTERVHKAYSFGTLPRLTLEFIENIFG